MYGLVYELTSSDEGALDKNEGVPYAYTKEILCVEYWVSKEEDRAVKVTDEGEMLRVLVYIDRIRTKEYVAKDEYVYRMNMGISDGVNSGLPLDYVQKVMRPFIPNEVNQGVQNLARKQALSFEDET